MCKPYLMREIAIVQPEVIVVLGNTAMKNLFDSKEGITKLRGRFQDYQGLGMLVAMFLVLGAGKAGVIAWAALSVVIAFEKPLVRFYPSAKTALG